MVSPVALRTCSPYFSFFSGHGGQAPYRWREKKIVNFLEEGIGFGVRVAHKSRSRAAV